MTASVYLAGPIFQVEDDGRGWRDAVTPWLEGHGLDVLNPLDHTHPSAATTDVVQRDLDLIDEADALLVRWQVVPTAGTPMEMQYAYDRGYPIVVWYEDDPEDLSVWVQDRATIVVDTIDDALATVVSHVR